MTNEQFSKEEAYGLTNAESHRKFYDGWADSYDSGFAVDEGYIYPEAVARRYLDLAEPGDSPVADLGCGTGLAGEYFVDSEIVIDGFDVSAGMLGQAREKGAYRRLQSTDLTQRSGSTHSVYGGLISSGTFTLGHLGPADLEICLGMARPGALCVIGINARHYEDQGFSDLFDRLAASGRVAGFRIEDASIYRAADDSQSENVAKLAVFRTGN